MAGRSAQGSAGARLLGQRGPAPGRPAAIGAGDRRGSVAGRAEPRLQPLPLRPPHEGHGATRPGSVARVSHHLGPGGKAVQRSTGNPGRGVGHRDPVRPADRTHAGPASAGDAGVGTTALELLPQRAVRCVDDGVAAARGSSRHDGLVGRRHGTDAVHAVELSETRGGLRQGRQERHLAVDPRCPGVDCQLPEGTTGGTALTPGAARCR